MKVLGPDSDVELSIVTRLRCAPHNDRPQKKWRHIRNLARRLPDAVPTLLGRSSRHAVADRRQSLFVSGIVSVFVLAESIYAIGINLTPTTIGNPRPCNHAAPRSANRCNLISPVGRAPTLLTSSRHHPATSSQLRHLLPRRVRAVSMTDEIACDAW